MEPCSICPVCKDYSETPHQLHYGGTACFSCRAFFRRAHQTTKEPDFKCKKTGKCEVTVKTRRKCQKCRYDLCLKIGMKPESVLTSDQKKKRFHNSFQKKSNQKVDNEAKRRRNLQQLVEIHDANLLDTSAKRIRLDFEPISVSIIRRFLKQTAIIDDKQSDLRKCFFQHLTALTKLFYELSLCLLDFVLIPYEDQTKLLMKNSPLFVQFMVAQWFKKSSHWFHFFPPALSHLTWNLMDSSLELFDTEENLIIYRQLIKIAALAGSKIKVQSLKDFCALILFQYDENVMSLDAQEKIHRLCEKWWSKCEDKCNTDLAELILTCEDMATLFADNVTWNQYQMEKPEEATCTTISCLPLPYNLEESCWFTLNLAKFDLAWNSVRFGDVIMGQVIDLMVSGNVLNKKLSMDCVEVLKKRFWLFLNLQEEFKSLNGREKNALWKKNCWYPIVLASARGRLSKGAMGQMKHYATPLDWKFVTSKIDNSKDYSLIEVAKSETSAGTFIKSKKHEFTESINKVASLVQNKELYKYFCLVLLFDGQTKIQHNFINALRRKLNHEQTNMGNKMIAEWNHSIHAVKNLAKMYAKIQD